MKPRILVVEDEPSILDNIIYSLETEGFEPHGCPTGGEARAALLRGPWALVVLDVGLPDVAGFELCREIRRTSNVPIIFLTARSSEVDRVVGLEIGGDDYMVKPFSPRELSARVKAVLRRFQAAPAAAPEPAPAATGDFRIDEERAQIHFTGVRLVLSGTEFRLLRALCEKPGRVFSRAQLMDIAWDDPGAALERTVDAHIKSLRAKLKEVSRDADPIETHRGFGYSLREAV
ncbi:MAG TPA: two-component system response regulator CreB [Chthoniobacteraceae bacterium]|nr:two-component system response regulator CreB [Chthoniobacteraceae bacterium]